MMRSYWLNFKLSGHETYSYHVTNVILHAGAYLCVCLFVCLFVCLCVRACVRARARMCVCVCVRARMCYVVIAIEF